MAKRAASERRKSSGGNKKRETGATLWGGRPPPQGKLDELRERLQAAAFNEASVAARLGVPHIMALGLDRYPVYATRLARRDALDVAIEVFLLQGEVPASEVDLVLGEGLAKHLLAAGFLERSGRGAGARVGSAFAIYPCAGCFFATDHRWRPTARLERRAPRAPVMYLGGDSYALAYLATRRPVRSALDLCTGSGVHAILATRHADRVTAVDVEGRALGFARFNAMLNGVADRIEWLRGDLFEPLPRGARFDLVLANPPFVPTPHAGRARIAFRDAGAAGEEVLARLVAGLPGRLERDGLAEIVSVYADGEGETYGAKLARWLPRGADVGALLLRIGSDGPAEYAVGQTRRAFGDDLASYALRHGRWVDTMRRAHVRRLSGGVLALRPRSGAATPPWFRAVDVPSPMAPAPEVLDAAWRSAELAQSFVFGDEVLERPARTPPGTIFTDEVERDPTDSASLRPRAHRVRSPGALLGAEVQVSPETRAVLHLADGTRPLRAVVGEIAPVLRASPGDLGDRLVPDLIELVARGLLLLDKG